MARRRRVKLSVEYHVMRVRALVAQRPSVNVWELKPATNNEVVNDEVNIWA